ncbi:MAG: excinuclease ABC subunit C, partial [Proteobacteria bacterium]|nr:excinuclease ABC subunit C [Pseudomonadota bacterium]
MTSNKKSRARALPACAEHIGIWPLQPGVYIMKDSTGRILYVGKAKVLRNRIRSYFQDPEKLTPKTRALTKRIASLEFTVTHTELEALLLECNLIKKHRPRYNVRLKDDKNFPYVVLDFTHPFPQFRITRKVIPSPELRYFGPYSGGIREIGRFLLKTFQIRDCSDSKFKNRTRPCLNYEIGTCTAPCVDYVSQSDYAKQIEDAIMFLKGRKQDLVTKLKQEMLLASEKLEFERARGFRDKISAIERITEKQNAVLTEKQKDI